MVLNSLCQMKLNRYTVLVCGDDVNLEDYNLNMKVPRYIRYKYAEREQMYNATIEMYEETIKQLSDQPFTQALLQIKLNDLLDLSPEEYFEELTKGYYYDEITGDALTDVNPNGRWLSLELPTLDTAVPLFNNNTTPFEGIKKDVIQDIDSKSKTIHNALFYNAFVSADTGWLEESEENSEEWVLTFYERFIKDLPSGTKLRVYNFTR